MRIKSLERKKERIYVAASAAAAAAAEASSSMRQLTLAGLSFLAACHVGENLLHGVAVVHLAGHQLPTCIYLHLVLALATEEGGFDGGFAHVSIV